MFGAVEKRFFFDEISFNGSMIYIPGKADNV